MTQTDRANLDQTLIDPGDTEERQKVIDRMNAESIRQIMTPGMGMIPRPL